MAKSRLLLPSGDASITSGSLHLPLRGVGVAVVEAHAEARPEDGAPASIVFVRKNEKADTFSGIIRKSALDVGRKRLSCTVVLGAGKLATVIGARDHHAGTTELPAGLLARSIVEEAGEQLADGVEAALDKHLVPHWTRVRGRAADALDLLVDVLGLSWRVLPSGKVWVGEETWPAASSHAVGYMLEDGGIRYAPDGAEILPGMAVDGRHVVQVDYMIGASLRADARDDVAGDPPHVPDRTAYERVYAATVVSQASDGSLELVPDDAVLGDDTRPLRGVPLRSGIPGARITYQSPAGERVRVAFEAADPRRIFAVPAHDQAASGATVHGVARIGDSGPAGTLTGTVLVMGTPTPVVFTYTPPQPGALAAVGEEADLSMVIHTGSEEVKIR